MRKSEKVSANTDEVKTTIRASVTVDEHEAIRRFAKTKMNMTIEEFVRLSVDEALTKYNGSTLAKMAENEHNRDKLVQMELF